MAEEAKGTHDSTLAGEFPDSIQDEAVDEAVTEAVNEAGKASSPRLEPKPISKYLYPVDDGNYGKVAAPNDVAIVGSIFSPIVAIRDNVITSQLSGIYKFNTPYFLDVAYWNFSAFSGQTIASGATVTSTNLVQATNYAPGGYFGGVTIDITGISPTGTATVSNFPDFFMYIQLSNFGYYPAGAGEFDTHDPLDLNFFYPTATQLTPGQTFSAYLRGGVQPAHIMNLPKPYTGGPTRNLFVNGETLGSNFNISVQINNSANGAVSVDSFGGMQFLFPFIYGFNTGAIVSTLYQF